MRIVVMPTARNPSVLCILCISSCMHILVQSAVCCDIWTVLLTYLLLRYSTLERRNVASIHITELPTKYSQYLKKFRHDVVFFCDPMEHGSCKIQGTPWVVLMYCTFLVSTIINCDRGETHYKREEN